jgi:hypothetical protein
VAFDWLYGPKAITGPNVTTIRSLTLERETVLEVLALVRKEIPTAALRAYLLGPGSVPLEDVAVDENRFQEAPDWQRRSVLLRDEAGSFVIDLREGQQPNVIYNNTAMAPVAAKAIELLYASGRPRPRWKNTLQWLPYVGVVLLVGVLAWLLVADWPGTPLAIFLALVAALASGSAMPIAARTRAKVGLGYPGHRIRTMSREEFRRHRLDSRRDIKVALLTGAISIIGTLVVTRLVG